MPTGSFSTSFDASFDGGFSTPLTDVSIVDIANQALDLMRSRATVSSIIPSDGTKAGDVLTRNFWPRLDALARSAPWNSHTYQRSLTVYQAAQGTPENPTGTTLPLPPVQWLYSYLLPDGRTLGVPRYLKARYLQPQPIVVTSGNIPITTGMGPTVGSGANSLPIIPFKIAGDTDASGNAMRLLYTNAEFAQLVYVGRNVLPAIWDQGFMTAAVATLAAWCCQPITGSNALMGELVQMANAEIASARNADGNEYPQIADLRCSWIEARNSPAAGVIAASSYGDMWDTMGWPGGAAF
jgi:hypothetical protein